jgi:hypothetical protein
MRWESWQRVAEAVSFEYYWVLLPAALLVLVELIHVATIGRSMLG